MIAPDFTAEFQLGPLQQMCDEDDSEDEEIVKAKHRRSLVIMEESLRVPCDESPIAPETMMQQQFASDGVSMERLLLERLLLRKELRLRNMQERLLEQEARIEQLQTRLGEIESAPGFSTFLTFSGCCQRTLSSSQEVVELGRAGLRWSFSLLYQMILYVFDLVPPSVSLAVAAVVQQAAALLAQRAQNYTNERAERAELENNGSKKVRGGNNSRRRRS